MQTFKVGSWEFSADMLETPTARKLVQLCFAQGFAYWGTSSKQEFFVIAGEVLSASLDCNEFKMFPLEASGEFGYCGSLSLIREDELCTIQLTPGERGRQDGIIARKSSKFTTEL